jgi:double-stranded uracil-DNA glycosylase
VHDRRVRRPTRDDLAAARDATVPDLVGPGLRVLLVGINPSLWSAWSELHFARPGNRLWRTLYDAGFTPRLLDPSDTGELIAAGLGITNLVARATARADELSDDEVRAGVAPLRLLVQRHRPAYVAFLGISTYRIAFGRIAFGRIASGAIASGARRATVGAQPETFEDARVWVLPNPSGLNASYQQPALTAAYAELRLASACQD